MESESTRILRKRHSELLARLDQLRAQIRPLQIELEQVERGMRAMLGTEIPVTGLNATRNAIAHHTRLANPAIAKLTIKQMTLKALGEHLSGGATANQLLEFFARRWGRVDLQRSSLSPQLTRLKQDGKIALTGNVWSLTEFGRQGATPDEPDENLEYDAQKENEPPTEDPRTAQNPR